MGLVGGRRPTRATHLRRPAGAALARALSVEPEAAERRSFHASTSALTALDGLQDRAGRLGRGLLSPLCLADVEIDVEVLKSEIEKTYASVSQEPEKDFAFPTGRA